MYGRKVKFRFFFIIIVLLSLILSVFLVLKSLEENVIFFKSPSEVKFLGEIKDKKIRIGGMVKLDSIKKPLKRGVFYFNPLTTIINSPLSFLFS